MVPGVLALAHCLYLGVGVEADEDRAIELISSYCSKNVFALLYLGGIHENRGDYRLAFECYSTAASRGSRVGQYRVGMYLKWGILGRIDQLGSFESLYLSAAHGHVYATREIAVYYLKGKFGLFNRLLGLGKLILAAFSIPVFIVVYDVDPRVTRWINPLELECPIEACLKDGW